MHLPYWPGQKMTFGSEIFLISQAKLRGNVAATSSCLILTVASTSSISHCSPTWPGLFLLSLRQAQKVSGCSAWPATLRPTRRPPWTLKRWSSWLSSSATFSCWGNLEGRLFDFMDIVFISSWIDNKIQEDEHCCNFNILLGTILQVNRKSFTFPFSEYLNDWTKSRKLLLLDYSIE